MAIPATLLGLFMSTFYDDCVEKIEDYLQINESDWKLIN